jgi:hypothetical protein
MAWTFSAGVSRAERERRIFVALSLCILHCTLSINNKEVCLEQANLCEQLYSSQNLN